MEFPVIDEQAFNIILWVLITIYGMTGIGNFLARTCDPRIDDDDAEIFKLNRRNYVFWLITSLIFFFFGISEFKNETLVYLTVIEIIILIIAYTYLLIDNQIKSSQQMKKIKEMKKEKLERLRKGY